MTTTQTQNAPGLHADCIPYGAAVAAHRGTSFVAEQRGSERQREFVATMQESYNAFAAHAERAGTQDILQAEWPRFLERSRSLYLVMLAAHSRIFSSMIAGPSNFPVRRMEKRNATAHNRTEAYLAHLDKGRKAIIAKLRPDLAPVRTGDSDAASELQKRIEAKEADQQAMKNANKLIRQHAKAGREAQLAALVAAGYSEQQAAGLLKPDFAGRVGFPGYALTNNNSEIRRLKARRADAMRYQEQAAAAGEASEHAFEGGVVVLDYADNRLRIQHDAKPSAEVIASLKAHGFRWSRQNTAWQRQLTDAAKAAARSVTGCEF